MIQSMTKINAAIPLIHHLILLAKVKFSKVKIKFQSSGLAPGACRPLLGDERVETGSISSKGSKGVGAAPDPSTQFSLFHLYIFEHPTFHSAQDDEMRRGV